MLRFSTGLFTEPHNGSSEAAMSHMMLLLLLLLLLRRDHQLCSAADGSSGSSHRRRARDHHHHDHHHPSNSDNDSRAVHDGRAATSPLPLLFPPPPPLWGLSAERLRHFRGHTIIAPNNQYSEPQPMWFGEAVVDHFAPAAERIHWRQRCECSTTWHYYFYALYCVYTAVAAA
eukprot:COSAG01_NODE_3339_length_6232_cov_10.685309_3_plen_173_part_00